MTDTSITYWVYEDDNTACLIKLQSQADPQSFRNGVAIHTLGSRTGFRNITGSPFDLITFSIAILESFLFNGLSSSKDAIVGMLVKDADMGQNYSDANMAVVNQAGVIEGRMMIVKH